MKDACSVTPEEMKSAGDWVSAHLGAARSPFSFIYGGESSIDFFKTWKFEQTSSALDDKRTEHVVTYTDPDTGLSVRSAVIEYHDFPTVEWTLYFKNTGPSDTPIVENIKALDLQIVREDLEKNSKPRQSSDEIRLHYHVGSPTTKEDYRPMVTKLASNSKKRITTSGGRPSNSHLPYFNLEWSGCGVIMAVGWPGQWLAEFTRDNAGKLRVSAGPELMHFKLYPDEEVRSPLVVLQFYQGDWIHAQNVWRRWMVAHNLPKPGGALPSPQVAASAFTYFAPMGISNALAMKIFIDHYEAKKIAIDAWWTDAGWYVCNFPRTDSEAGEGTASIPAATGMAEGDPSWPNTGTWEADPYRFPRGVREVSDHAHAKGLKTILWFEPERVMPGSRLAEEHPDWLLAPLPNPGDQFYEKNTRLLNLGNPDAWQWLLNYIDEFLTREGVDVYREDFNMDPLYFWRANDTPDRQGITEIRHVTGHLAYWDALRQRHPNMLLDTCASGGKRNDLESLRRAVPLCRSDYTWDITANQCITYGLAFWIPYFGAGITAIDPYRFRSYMSPSIVLDLDPRRDDLDLDLWHRLIRQFKQVAKYYLGDYYPLTGYSLESDVWMAWQFDCPEIGEGMVQVFRRENSPAEAARFPLRGLQAKELYTVTNLDRSEVQYLPGRTLMEDGVLVEITKKPGAVIITYKCECK